MVKGPSSVYRLILAALLVSSVPVSARADWRYSRICVGIVEEIEFLAEHDGCRRSSDCATVDLPEPLGCALPVTKAYAYEIDRLMSMFKRRCGPLLYTCYAHTRSIWCERGRCVPKLRLGGRPYASVTSRDSNGRPLR